MLAWPLECPGALRLLRWPETTPNKSTNGCSEQLGWVDMGLGPELKEPTLPGVLIPPTARPGHSVLPFPTQLHLRCAVESLVCSFPFPPLDPGPTT
jgi:hypothetical protein